MQLEGLLMPRMLAAESPRSVPQWRMNEGQTGCQRSEEGSLVSASVTLSKYHNGAENAERTEERGAN